MEKYTVMAYNQISMSWVGIHSLHLHEPQNEFFKSIGTYYILFSAISITILSSAVFVYKNASDFELVSEPCLIVIAGVQLVGMFISYGLNMKQIKRLHIKLQKIIDESKKIIDDTISSLKYDKFYFAIYILDNNREIFNIYWNTERKCRQLTKLMPLYPLMLMFVAAILYSFYCLLTGNLDTTTWILPYRMSVPFNTKPIHGWYLFWFLQANTGMSYSLVMVTISSYFVCCCFYIEAVCKHFDYLIYSLKKGGSDDINDSKFNCRNVKETLSEAVRVHNMVFE